MHFEDCLDPELRTAFAAMSAPGDLTGEVATKRLAISKAVAASPVSLPAHITIENRSIPGPQGAPEVGIRLYLPHTEAALRPGLLWIHGGGFLYGSPIQDDSLCFRFAEEIGCVIVSVDWRLAPEYPYPAGVEDCYAALLWMVASASDLAIDPSRVAVAGASAGGGVAAAVALLARDRGGPRLAFQMLLYGCFDDRHLTPSSTSITDERVWNTALSQKAWKLYLAESNEHAISPYATPARASDLTHLPPAYLCVGEADLLRDEDIVYATRLMQAGVPTELHVYPGAFHGFERMVPTAQVSKRAMSEYIAALKRGLSQK